MENGPNTKFEVPPLPRFIEGLLHKKVQSPFSKVFKSTIERWFAFNIDTCQLCYKNSSFHTKYSKIHTKREIYNFEPSVEKEDPLRKVFKYGFKILTIKRTYVLFTDNKEFYDTWMRMLNYYFNKIDVLKERLPIKLQIKEIPKLYEEVIQPEEKTEEECDEEKSSVSYLEEISSVSKISSVKEVSKIQIENLHFKNIQETRQNESKNIQVKNNSKNNIENVVTKQFDNSDKALFLDSEKQFQNENLNRKKVDLKKKILKKPMTAFDLLQDDNFVKYEEYQENQAKLEEIKLKEQQQPKKEPLYDELGRIIIQINNDNEFIPENLGNEQLINHNINQNNDKNREKIKFLDDKSVLNITKSFLKKHTTNTELSSFVNISTINDQDMSITNKNFINETSLLKDIDINNSIIGMESNLNLIEGEVLIKSEKEFENVELKKINIANEVKDSNEETKNAAIKFKKNSFIEDFVVWDLSQIEK